MDWISKIDRIVVLNLTKRTDRLLQITEHFEEYEIPFERVTAIESDNGAEGLRDTMIELFKDCIEKKMQYVLVFEDDAFFVTQKQTVHNTMNEVMNNLPANFNMIFLGTQLTGKVLYFHSPNIIAGSKMFSTHSVLYSLKGMKEVLASDLQAPIDNHFVDKLEPQGESYAVVPLLCSQRSGYSDICKNEISWGPFIEPRFNQQIADYRG